MVASGDRSLGSCVTRKCQNTSRRRSIRLSCAQSPYTGRNPCHGDKDGLVVARTDPPWPCNEWRCLKKTGSHPNHKGNEGSVHHMVQPCPTQQEKFCCKNSPPLRPTSPSTKDQRSGEWKESQRTFVPRPKDLNPEEVHNRAKWRRQSKAADPVWTGMRQERRLLLWIKLMALALVVPFSTVWATGTWTLQRI